MKLTREHALQLSLEERASLATPWRLQREFYLACQPTTAQIRRFAMRLRADADWLNEVAAGLDPIEAALTAEYGPTL